MVEELVGKKGFPYTAVITRGHQLPAKCELPLCTWLVKENCMGVKGLVFRLFSVYRFLVDHLCTYTYGCRKGGDQKGKGSCYVAMPTLNQQLKLFCVSLRLQENFISGAPLCPLK